MTGTVKSWSRERGWGFVLAAGRSYFCHYKDVSPALASADGRRNLTVGREVEFEPAETDRGPKALDVRPTGAAPDDPAAWPVVRAELLAPPT